MCSPKVGAAIHLGDPVYINRRDMACPLLGAQLEPPRPPSHAGSNLLETIKVPRGNFAAIKGKLPPAQYETDMAGQNMRAAPRAARGGFGECYTLAVLHITACCKMTTQYCITRQLSPLGEQCVCV